MTPKDGETTDQDMKISVPAERQLRLDIERKTPLPLKLFKPRSAPRFPGTAESASRHSRENTRSVNPPAL